jgi:1-acyl-sn-glycerol-3-phosphate acyltransferase
MSEKNRVNLLYWLCHFLISIYMRTFCRLKLAGQDKIPPQAGLIIASNHIAGADPFLLGSAVPRELWYMAKKELFKSFFLGWFIKRVNAFPVDRFGFDLEVIKKSISLLKQGKALIMFPEGTRSKDGQIMEGKIGVGMLAHKAGVPIVPVYMENTKKAWMNLFLGKRMKVSFGEVIDKDWICSRPGTKEGYSEITSLLMAKIKELSIG